MPKFSHIVTGKFLHEPTEGQQVFFEKMDDFLEEPGRSVLLLKGFAGTGKTSIVSALVRTLPLFNFKFLLLAPTGRASKVMAGYAKRQAFTIHKIIYKAVYDKDSGRFHFALQKSYHQKTIFIVDEGSMLSDSRDFGGLLDDLLTFVFSGNGNKLLLIGDTAQLPPIGQSASKSLSQEYYLNRDLKVSETILTEVQRQDLDSGILTNATALRSQLEGDKPVTFRTKEFQDVFALTGEKMEDGLRYAYQKYGPGNAVIISRSNKQAVKYNEFIRRTIFFHENEIDVGDILMIIKNNYYYSPPETNSGFLANGDFAEVMRVITYDQEYDHRFADLELKLLDQESDLTLSAKVMLDTIYLETTALGPEASRELYHKVSESYSDINKEKERREALASDPHLNALQVKFAYALTCHKSQGGQWDAVFVDQGYVKKEDLHSEGHKKWLYTAITRATRELYLINFAKDQFVIIPE